MREMKDSGVEWIGEIPIEWDIIKCKYVSNLYTGNSIKDENKSFYEDSTNAVPYIATKDIDVIFNTINYENGLYIKNNDDSFVRANKNDILMCIEGGSAGRKKARVDKTVCFINKLCCFHPLKIDSLFLYYLLNSPHYEKEFRFNISGLIGGVSKSKLMNFIFPYPLLEEQQKISAYLDDKCTKIDSMIEKQQKIIDKLKEYKQSIITEAVTKGLNLDVKMKNSGIEWIGKIPENWNIGKISYFFEIQLGKMLQPNKKHETDTLENYLCALNVGNNKIKLSPLKQMWFSVSEKEIYSLRAGDLLVVEGGDIASCDIICCDLNNTFFQNALHRVKAKQNCDLRILKYFLWFAKSIGHIDLICNKATIAHFSKEKFLSLPYIVMNINQQQQIADYLDKKCSAIDSAIEKKQAIIEKLQEYKKSLIYEVVTGKKEV